MIFRTHLPGGMHEGEEHSQLPLLPPFPPPPLKKIGGKYEDASFIFQFNTQLKIIFGYLIKL